jgi:hypothetical protein
MGLRRWLSRLEHAARDNLEMESFELEDGSRYYYDPVSPERFLHSMECQDAQGDGETTFPQPPETVRALLRARDRAAALEQVYQSGSFVIFPYEHEALVERGELVPRYMVAGRELGEWLPDLSE